MIRIFAITLLTVVGAAAGDLSDLKVFPPDVNLTSKNDRQSVVVQAIYSDGVTRDVTTEATVAVADKALAKLDQNTLHPLADGKTTLDVKFGGRSVSVPLLITNSKTERSVSFKLDVVPTFAKAGCNSGSCHGSARGKDGFRLSLFGFDPDGDYYRLTRENIGRRINLAIPEESLILDKGLGIVQHTGGERFKPDSELYNTILTWLKDGAPNDGTNVAKVVAVDIMPREAVLAGTGAVQRLTVRAKYSDGTDRDVTSLAVFMSNNDVAAKVSETGVITAAGRGEAFVMARFAAFTVGSQVIVIPKDVPYRFPADVAANNYVDELVHAKLKKLRI
ncbi:MAG TPA: cell surface protein, partial [Candidatus Binatia bacterium]|nr:cell surface protein [Candidatus Binatia bacterium]